MPHKRHLLAVLEQALAEMGATGCTIDVYRAHRLDDWRAIVKAPDATVMHLRFTIGENPDWDAIAAEARRQMQPPR